MTKISSLIAYSLKNSPVADDYVIGTNSETSQKPTRNFSMQAISNFVLGGLEPEEGGVIAITQLEPVTAETSPAVVANALSPDYEVGRYELLFLDLNGHQYLLKTPNVTIGAGGVTLTDDDFIDFPVNEGADGRGITSIELTGTAGLVDTYTITYTDETTSTFEVTNGSDGDDGINADMTRTSVTSNAIANSGSKTFAYSSSTNLGWLFGTRLRFANDASNYMEGTVTAVSATSVTATMDNSVGSGTYTSWNIGIAGDKGTAGDVAGSIVTEDSNASLVITTQTTANLDYDLNFQIDGDKCFVTGTVTNSTGIAIGAQNIFTFVNSAYNARTALVTRFYAGVNNVTEDLIQLFEFNGANLTLLGDMENGKIAYINCFYYIN